MTERELEISFKSELYSEGEKVVHYKRPWMGGSRILYKHRIYATGKDIDKIRAVKYILHPTFPNPIRTVKNRDKNFELTLWAWGGFRMNIIVTTIDGEVYNYWMSTGLHDLLREAKGDKSVEWKDELSEQYPL